MTDFVGPADPPSDDDLFSDLFDDATAAKTAAQTLRPVPHPALRDAGIYLLNEAVMQWRTGWEPFCEVVDPTDAAAVKALPTAPGVYAFVTPGHFHPYPCGASSVMYLGKAGGANGLRGRLSKHAHCLDHIARRTDDRFYPVYEWAATYKPLVTYAVAGDDAEDPKTLEYELLKVFAGAYRVVPVANSQSAW